MLTASFVQLLIILMALGLVGNAYAAEAKATMMTVASEDLNGKEIKLPIELPAEHTLLLVAFQREQQENINTWVKGMNLEGTHLPWLELPVIENPGMIGRWFINSGMRRGISGDDKRAHVISLYTDKQQFIKSLGITDEHSVYAAVVNRQGKVLRLVKGDYSPEGAKKLTKLLKAENLRAH